jgi:hypothetical protein
MQHLVKLIALSFILLGCSAPSLDFFKSNRSLSALSLPSIDHGYVNLKTRVISSNPEYKAFLNAIDSQSGWDHKVAFGMNIAKAHVNFKKENLLIYRHTVNKASKALVSKIISTKEKNVTVTLEESGSKTTDTLYQAFFYTVAKSVKRVTFKSKQRVVTVKNSKNKTVIPKECVAWFDGCNHCIRSTTGRALCTKRYCKQKGAFRCVKWK